MLQNQEGDVLLFQSNNGGEITVESGFVQMSPGIETSVYLSLFGGNEEDDAGQDTTFTWWANIDEVDPVKEYRSETQYLLNKIAATSGNLLRIEEAARRDLTWLLEEKIASEITVVASIPSINRIKLVIDITVGEQLSTIEIQAKWRDSQ